MSVVEDVKPFEAGNIEVPEEDGPPSVRTRFERAESGPVYDVMRFPAFFTCHVPVLLAFFASVIPVQASPSGEGAVPEEEETADLPVWEEGDCRESFDVRLWPARTTRWLEQENLRDLIADPDLAETERTRLKHLLSFSRGWRMHSRSGIAEVN